MPDEWFPPSISAFLLLYSVFFSPHRCAELSWVGVSTSAVICCTSPIDREVCHLARLQERQKYADFWRFLFLTWPVTAGIGFSPRGEGNLAVIPWPWHNFSAVPALRSQIWFIWIWLQAQFNESFLQSRLNWLLCKKKIKSALCCFLVASWKKRSSCGFHF